MHISVRDVNTKLSKSAKKYNFITPRDFLNFIKQFISLYSEKKGELEELQSHLQVGITKLENTETSVAELSNKLKSYDIELKKKKEEVNEQMKALTT
jgi:dynein heavy chain 1